ncbi:MAG: tRNA guanosine(34) transglycosylase Tgt [Patescibacteria group bacterium]|jgi:queuine tRNA-ribosyltransferase
MLEIKKRSKISQARTGVLRTLHGVIDTPFFMPIATKAAVKGIGSAEVADALGSQIILSNTYHLLLEPGMDILKRAGGLHEFMNWPRAILTDSGGFQVYSLGKLRKITEKGVTFKNPRDGKSYELTPENVIKYQNIIGSDIMMVLDECTEYPCGKTRAKESMEMSLRWARRCKEAHDKLKLKDKTAKGQLLFGIVQGSIYKDLREECARRLVEIGFDGYALGGVSVGATAHHSYEVLDWTFDNLPYDKPRYVLGMGTPDDIIEGVKRGVDMFDCVIPTREGRHGRLFLWKRDPKSKILNPKQIQNSNFLNSKHFYDTVNITNAKFKKDLSPINKESKLPELREHSKAYLHHLLKTQEALGYRLASLNNLEFYLELMRKIRKSIKSGKL